LRPVGVCLRGGVYGRVYVDEVSALPGRFGEGLYGDVEDINGEDDRLGGMICCWGCVGGRVKGAGFEVSHGEA
jgi:hypothetical protein